VKSVEQMSTLILQTFNKQALKPHPGGIHG
jgi:hypothetical protein